MIQDTKARSDDTGLGHGSGIQVDRPSRSLVQRLSEEHWCWSPTQHMCPRHLRWCDGGLAPCPPRTAWGVVGTRGPHGK